LRLALAGGRVPLAGPGRLPLRLVWLIGSGAVRVLGALPGVSRLARLGLAIGGALAAGRIRPLLRLLALRCLIAVG
jgi:hypothetical protein